MKLFAALFSLPFIFACLSATSAVAEPSSQLHWYILDVTKHLHYGDCFLLVDTNHTVLIDTGNTSQDMYDLIKDQLTSLLTKHGRVAPFTIDLVIITHPHDDHYGGLLRMLLPSSPFAIKEIFLHNPSRLTGVCGQINCTEISYIETLASRRSVILKHYDEDEFPRLTFANGGAHLEKLADFYPDNCPKLDGDTKCNVNNLCAVSRLVVGDHNYRVYFGADQERAESLWVMNHFSTDDLKSDILKVPHHANPLSMSSDPSFFKAVAPHYGVASSQLFQWCNLNNKGLHDLLKSMGTIVYMTCVNGQIGVHFDTALNPPLVNISVAHNIDPYKVCRW
eukprot:TRINITY_DN3301_c0_g1_i1.p1 TRINITY_DN3301_c0_g1~~TRINITY_DN3301_c0_g1_i1.p1  ORF type:complete len:336 (-),score=28.19 TRINITY_DN3301_c0_g1_i1:109-1116(-)